MPERATIQRAARKRCEGKAPTTQAGEFVREEIHHIREGKHGARSSRQAIAIALSKARKAGVDLPPPPAGSASARSARSGHKRANKEPARKRARVATGVLQHEPRASASSRALARQAHASAARRGAQSRHAAARKSTRTKGKAGLHRAGVKAARARYSNR